MSKNYFDEIEVPDRIDSFIKEGIKKASHEKTYEKKKSIKNIIVASISAIIIIGIVNPALASKIPIIGNVFEIIEEKILFPTKYSQYATAIDQVVTSNGISVTLKEVVCDGYKLYVTYSVENEKPFKWTYTEEKYDHLDITQLGTIEEYNRASFTDQELPTWEFSGINGGFIDDKTFVGMHTYNLEALGVDIPDKFDFEIKITSFMTRKQGRKIPFMPETKMYNGSWAFKVPVEVERSFEKEVNINESLSNGVTLDSIIATPLETIVTVDYGNESRTEDDILQLYEVKMYDEQDNEIRMKGGESYGNIDKHFFEARENISNIKVVLYKYNYEVADNNSKHSDILNIDGVDYVRTVEETVEKTVEIK